MDSGVSIIIPTLNGGKIFSECLKKINQQDYSKKIQLIIIDSGSTDGTLELAEKSDALVLKIDKKEFHHARTRNKALSFAAFNKVIYLVQDAIPYSNSWLYGMENALSDRNVCATYVQQVPHDNASLYARFAVESHSNTLGQESVLQSIDSFESFHMMPYEDAYRAIRLDNVCAIYRKELLEKNPFPEFDFAEDLAWAYKNISTGYKIKYEPKIKIRHSHDRPPGYNFNRHVVDSIFCAKIMNRVKDDFSFLTTRDLIALTISFQKFAGQLKSDIADKSLSLGVHRSGSMQIIDKIFKSYPLKYRVIKFVEGRLLNRLRPQTAALKAIDQHSKAHTIYCIDFIKENYQIKSNEELLESLEQITASVLGRLYGEVYASRLVKGELTPEFEDFIRPYRSNV
jgi:glycosyltransferase involved in cell wall biosynthesis